MFGHGSRLPALLLAGLAAAGCSGGSDKKDVSISAKAGQFGASGAVVDYDGDGLGDLVVGAPYAMRSDGGVGAVHVHRGTATGFEEAAAFTLTGGDNFGSTVEEVGDVDGDGRADFAVAAVNGDGPAASLCGEVTVYKGGARGTVLARLAGEMALDKFGASVTGGCDLDADGHPDLVVGATHHSPAPDRWLGGAYYVYFGPDFSEQRRIKLPATGTKGILGFSSACGDLNGDGVDDLAVSAIWTHGVIWHASDVLAWYGGPGFAPRTDAPDVDVSSSASHFGDGLAILPDLDGDAFGELAIGVPALYAVYPYAFPTATNPMPGLRGTVFLVKGGTGARAFSLSPPRGTPLPADVLTVLYGGEYLERFGALVESIGDVDGDGRPDLAVGSPHAHAPGASGLDTGWVTGAFRVYSGKDLKLDGTVTEPAVARLFSRAQRNLHYGQFLARFERGGPRVAVGAPTANRLDGTVFVEDLTPPAP